MEKTIFKSIGIAICLMVALPNAFATTFKVATISPGGSSWMKTLRAAGSEIEERTEGRVKFKFYPGGVMGDDQAVLRKMRARQVTGGLVQTGAFNQSVPSVQVYNLPMMFRSLDEVTKVRAQLDEPLKMLMADAGFEALGFAGVGFAYAMGSKPIQDLESARKRKVWSPKGDPVAARILGSFGVTPIPLGIVDVMAGLQTGLIDTVTAPPVSVIALQWHTQIKYMLDVPLMYIYSVFILDKRQFDKLTMADREVVRQSMGMAIVEAEKQNYKDHQATTDALKQLGVKMLQPTAAELAQWIETASRVPDMWKAARTITPSIHDEFLAALGKARGSVVH